MRRLLVIASLFVGLLVPFTSVHGASGYADLAFLKQWQQGEALSPNFWGPLANAKEGLQEDYKEATGGKRLVQYFDKGRMELTGGAVTNGLLASELVKGRLQTGDDTFQPKSAPALSMAGDPNSGAPTYHEIATTGNGATTPKPDRTGQELRGAITHGIYAEANAKPGIGDIAMAFFDPETKHNVMRAFLDYRNKVGLTTVGLAVTEPLAAKFRVGGVVHSGAVQVFERRVLTYTLDNPDPFKVEMGNIGQHYYQWRYGTTPVAIVPTSAPSSAPMPAKAADGLTATDSTGFVRAYILPGWKHDATFEFGAVTLALIGPGPTALGFTVVSGAKNLDDAAAAVRNSTSGDITTRKVGAITSTSVGGEDGRTFAYITDNSSGTSYGKFWIATHGGKTLIAISSSPDSDSTVLDSILTTVQFLMA